MDDLPPAPRTVVFGSLDGSQRTSKNDHDSSGSSNDSKQNPLLANGYDGSTSEREPRRRPVKRYSTNKLKFETADTSDGATFCRCIGHLLTLFLPLIAMMLMLALLILLVIFDHEYLQDIEVYENVNATDLAGIYYMSVQSDSISLVMSQYEPYAHVLALSSSACVLISMVTVARNIQIEVYHKRTGSRVFMKFVNYLAAIINILSYIGLMVAVNFKITQESPEWAPKAHYIGFLTFFAGTATYSVLHQFLLWRQSEYPLWIKVLFFLITVAVVGSSVSFGLPLWYGGLATDELGEPVYEWVAVFASTIGIGLFVVLFFIDPADDQLANFFCGAPLIADAPRGRRQKGGNGDRGKGKGGKGKQNKQNQRMRRGSRRMMEVPMHPQQRVAYNMMPLDSELYQI
mmetsp:Transcript_2831/g.7768  ORF Transcript_2831/g.7768 Transcript_2831/m.7768 type:complete len:402 (-) Transcript_2831:316-1521(-)